MQTIPPLFTLFSLVSSHNLLGFNQRYITYPVGSTQCGAQFVAFKRTISNFQWCENSYWMALGASTTESMLSWRDGELTMEANYTVRHLAVLSLG